MSRLQNTLTVTYGALIALSITPVLPQNAPLIRPSFFSYACPPVRLVPPVTPSLLLCQILGSYAQGRGLPFSDGQNLPYFRGTGVRKGAGFFKNVSEGNYFVIYFLFLYNAFEMF